jgi:hypothetical protein
VLKPLFRAAIAATFLVLCAAATAADSVIVITSHEVSDFAAWKKGFDAGKANRDKAGLTQRYIVRNSDKPNLVTIVLAGENLENAKKFVSEVKERMKNNKIIVGEPDIKIGNIAK